VFLVYIRKKGQKGKKLNAVALSKLVQSHRMSSNKNQKQEEQMPRVIVGAVWDPSPRRWWVPPGLEQTHDLPISYRTVHFGADREYGPEEGWQRYSSRRQKQAARHKNRKLNPVYYQESEAEEDSYDFHE
jgi:hypothetical protein